MPKPNREQKIRLAAYLRGREKLDEAEIALRLGGITQSTVSNLLKDAKLMNLFEETTTYHGGDLSPQDEDYLYTMTFQSGLHTRMQEHMGRLGLKHAPRI